MENNLDWRMKETWNIAMERPSVREEKERVHLWASELQKAPVDMWLRFKNTPVTNPPNGRSQMKFKTGELFEWWMGIVLKHAGILKSSQEYTKFCIDSGLLEVSGKADFIAGGIPNLTSARDFAHLVDMPMFMVEVVDNLVTTLSEKYPGGLGVKPIEIKSVSSFVMNRLEITKEPLSGHKLQLLHYIIGGKHDQGSLVYVCRDDLRMMEFSIHFTPDNVKQYRDAVAKLTMAVQASERPVLEPFLVYEGKFNINYNIAYSGYLTMLYGFEQQMEYEDKYRPIASKFNRVMGRMARGEKITPKNLIILDEMRAEGYEPEELVKTFIVAKDDEDSTE